MVVVVVVVVVEFAVVVAAVVVLYVVFFVLYLVIVVFCSCSGSCLSKTLTAYHPTCLKVRDKTNRILERSIRHV